MRKQTLLIIPLVLLLASCAQRLDFAETIYWASPYGFWHGLWHGFIAPLTLFATLLDDSIAVYGINNTGFGYDFGFLLGASTSIFINYPNSKND